MTRISVSQVKVLGILIKRPMPDAGNVVNGDEESQASIEHTAHLLLQSDAYQSQGFRGGEETRLSYLQLELQHNRPDLT